MHRTTTTATLLVTVAVSALAGCVTVQRPPVPGPPTAPSQPAPPPPAPHAEPQIVQAPALEALERVGPPRQRERPTSEPHRPTSHTPAPTAEPPPSPAKPAPHPPSPRRPEPRRTDPPRTRVPDVPESVGREIAKDVPKSQEDVCALGRKYGGWRADSPESVICGETYGR
ncbi:hypothetical protein ACWC10_24580 [Streptomyces sp. NPDC001595]|uniref:hypothetical protein n=1 Tax=Streptomyces sp. NPDC001532 TaxID=3154520 RepID=UPI0033233E2C